MARYFPGSRRDPLLDQFDRRFERPSLHEAKLSAWMLATGAPGRHPATASRRLHRGLLPDLPPPQEPPPDAARPPLARRLWQALRAFFGAAAARPMPAAAAAVADGANIAYIERTNAADTVAAPAAGAAQPVRSRAA